MYEEFLFKYTKTLQEVSSLSFWWTQDSKNSRTNLVDSVYEWFLYILVIFLKIVIFKEITYKRRFSIYKWISHILKKWSGKNSIFKEITHKTITERFFWGKSAWIKKNCLWYPHNGKKSKLCARSMRITFGMIIRVNDKFDFGGPKYGKTQ